MLSKETKEYNSSKSFYKKDEMKDLLENHFPGMVRYVKVDKDGFFVCTKD